MKIKIYDIIALSIVLYYCESFSLVLRKERRLNIFENKILRRIFGFKSDEHGEWKVFYNHKIVFIVYLTYSGRLRESEHLE